MGLDSSPPAIDPDILVKLHFDLDDAHRIADEVGLTTERLLGSVTDMDSHLVGFSMTDSALPQRCPNALFSSNFVGAIKTRAFFPESVEKTYFADQNP
jgi:hypothetical protein